MILEKMTDSSSIFITGFMGAGKTTIAKYLSSLMGMAWFDLDSVIQKHEQMSVQEIFRLKGESYFREQEYRVINQINTPWVVSLGGGAYIERRVRQLISVKGWSVLLDVPFDVLWERVKNKKKRPLVKSYGELSWLMDQRKFLYQVADIVHPVTVLEQPRKAALAIHSEICDRKSIP